MALALLVPGIVAAQEPITLKQAVELAQKQGFLARAAVASRDAARARDRSFNARLLPQVSLDATAPTYERSITPVIQPDGSTLFTPVQQTTANAGMRIAQKLPFTGGNLSVRSSLQRYQLSGAQSGGGLTWTSTPVRFELEQPIMRANAIRWDDRLQDVRLEVAERQYLESREGVALQATSAFFDFFVAKKTLENTVLNAAVNDTLYTLNKGRLEVGKIGENDLLQSELALLRARQAADNARLEFGRAQDALRLALNQERDAPLDVAVPSDIPDFEPDTSVAVAQALAHRSQASQLDLDALGARRQVAEAKLNNGLGAVVNASVGFNQTAADVNLAYQNLLQAQRFSLGVSIPLLQWGVRGAEIDAARAEQKRVEAVARASREQIAQDARYAALQLMQARRNVTISAKSDTVAQKRFEVAYNRYVIGRIGIDNLYIAQNEKDQAVSQYLQALRGYWSAYYRLRMLTLYDFEAGAAIH